MAKYRGRVAEVVRAWVVVSDCQGTEKKNYFDKKADALWFVKCLPRSERIYVKSVYETGVASLDGELIAIVPSWDMFDTGFTQSSGEYIEDSEVVDEDELAVIIENGRANEE